MVSLVSNLSSGEELIKLINLKKEIASTFNDETAVAEAESLLEKLALESEAPIRESFAFKSLKKITSEAAEKRVLDRAGDERIAESLEELFAREVVVPEELSFLCSFYVDKCIEEGLDAKLDSRSEAYINAIVQITSAFEKAKSKEEGESE